MRVAPFDDGLLVYAHVGDLHVTAAAERNYTDLLSIAAQIETRLARARHPRQPARAEPQRVEADVTRSPPLSVEIPPGPTV